MDGTVTRTEDVPLMPHGGASGYFLKQTGARWDPAAAACERWTEFLRSSFADPEALAALQEAAGFALVGEVAKDAAIVILLGEANAGKSLFVKALARACGSYWASIGVSALAGDRFAGAGSHQAGLAPLIGARAASTDEVPEKHRLQFDSGKIKSLFGGGDFVSVRPIHSEAVQFRCVAGLWLTGNHGILEVPDAPALASRILLVEVPGAGAEAAERGRREGLDEYLTTDPGAQAAVLRWMLEGLIRAAANGRVPCGSPRPRSRRSSSSGVRATPSAGSSKSGSSSMPRALRRSRCSAHAGSSGLAPKVFQVSTRNWSGPSTRACGSSRAPWRRGRVARTATSSPPREEASPPWPRRQHITGLLLGRGAAPRGRRRRGCGGPALSFRDGRRPDSLPDDVADG